MVPAVAKPWALQTISERIVTAVERIEDRRRRVTAALEAGGVPYAVVGGNAVAAWVATVDPAATRFTKDVDILLRRADLDAAVRAVGVAGFFHHQTLGVDMFIDGPDGGAKDAVHLLFALEKVKPTDVMPTPDVHPAERPDDFNVVALESLVRMKLNAFRRKDQVHLIDMLDVGLIDTTWPARYPPELAARLQELIDTPEG
jgi:hypothetical protein